MLKNVKLAIYPFRVLPGFDLGENRIRLLYFNQGNTIASRDFPWPTVAVCADGRTDRLASGLDNRNVEIWRDDLSTRIGVPIDQLSYFKDKWRPDQLIHAQLSGDERRVLTVTHFCDPPNLGYFWISLYGIATGLPLVDNLSVVDEDIDCGVFTEDAMRIALGLGQFTPAFKPIRVMLLLPEKDDSSRLIVEIARIAERLPPEGVAK